MVPPWEPVGPPGPQGPQGVEGEQGPAGPASPSRFGTAQGNTEDGLTFPVGLSGPYDVGLSPAQNGVELTVGSIVLAGFGGSPSDALGIVGADCSVDGVGRIWVVNVGLVPAGPLGAQVVNAVWYTFV